MSEAKFVLSGLTCAACAARVEKAVTGLAGTREVGVNFLNGHMRVVFDETRLSAGPIIKAVEAAGYGAALKSEPDARPKETPPAAGDGGESGRLKLSAAFTLPLFYLAMGPMLGCPSPGFLSGPENSLSLALTQFLLLIPVLGANSGRFKAGFGALIRGAPQMDSLIALGSGAAALYSLAGLYVMGYALGWGEAELAHHWSMNLYFESGAMILTLTALGRRLESGARTRALDALTKLMNLSPKTARVERDGDEVIIPAEEIQVGDVVIVKTGETVPADGFVLEGQAAVDESALTGESLPADKGEGDRLIGASVCRSGFIKMRAVKIGGEAVLAQIIRLVEEAAAAKAPIARLADKISGRFVPAVMALAAVSALVWLWQGQTIGFALSAAISVLVVSCPCALGLAVPTAIMVGAGRGAAYGILIKSAPALEAAHNLDALVMDKTGTLTEGRPAVTEIISLAASGPEELLRLAASLEVKSEHPLASAIVERAEREGLGLLPTADFRQLPGRGLSALIDGRPFYAGNLKLVAELGLPLEELRPLAEGLAEAGATPIFLADQGRVLGIIALADALKPEAPQAVAALKELGLEVIMLTGDNARTAEAVRRRLGLEKVIAEVLPQDKERVIRELKAQGRRVGMVGDGVNDAPALVRADVGLALGAGSDIALDSADLILVRNDLRSAAAAIELSRAVMRNIRQNLFWAFFYNIIGLPIAAGLFYKAWGLTLNPMIAAAAMSLSSLCVVSNALRLRFFSPKIQLGDPPAGGPPSNAPQGGEKMQKVILIEGMSCAHCAGRVETALKGLVGVEGVTVDLKAKTALVELSAEAPDESLKAAVEKAGYKVLNVKNQA